MIYSKPSWGVSFVSFGLGGIRKLFLLKKFPPPQKKIDKSSMIITVIGIPGSGKSFWAVKTTLEYIASGGVVFSNIRLKGLDSLPENEVTEENKLFRFRVRDDSPVRDYLRKFMKWDYKEGQYSFIDLDQYDSSFLSLIPYGSQGKRILLILDEVNEWFDSLDRGKLSKDEKYRELFKFLRLSRHYHIDVVFLLQDFNTLNPRLRGLCAKIIESTDMQKMRIGGFPIPFPFPWFLWKEYDNKGKHVLRSETWVKDQRIFDCYDSFCEVGSVGLSGQLVKTDFANEQKKGNGGKKMSWFDRVFVYGALVFLLWSWYGNGKREQAIKNDIVNTVSRSVVSNQVYHVVSSNALSLAVPALPRREFIYADFSFSLLPTGRQLLFINGVEMFEGQYYEWGRLMSFSDKMAHFIKDDLTRVYVYPKKDDLKKVVAVGSRSLLESNP